MKGLQKSNILIHVSGYHFKDIFYPLSYKAKWLIAAQVLHLQSTVYSTPNARKILSRGPESIPMRRC